MEAVRTLDRSRPYGQIFGLPGAEYEQDGIMFTIEGRPVGADHVRPILEGNSDQQRLSAAASMPTIRQGNVSSTETKPSVNLPAPATREMTDKEIEAKGFIKIETAHWKVLKSLVETKGGKWTNKQDAYNFLADKLAEERDAAA